MANLRQTLAAMILDAPRFEPRLLGPSWTRIHNRGEHVRIDAAGAVECDWPWTSALHYCRLFPSASTRLMRAALRDWPLRFADRPVTAAQPEVTFVIGHRGMSRIPHLLLTLRSIAAQESVAIECIVIEQDSESRIAHLLPPWVTYLFQRVDAGAPYGRAATFNEAARAAKGTILVLHDNDMLVPARYAAELVRKAGEGFAALDLKRFIFYVGQDDSARIAERGTLTLDERSEQVIQNLRGGSIAIAADAYRAIGGFDESFVGWGGEDVEFWERAETHRTTRFGYLPIVHIWHAPQPEKLQANEAPAVKRYYELAEIPVAERIRRLTAR